MHLMSFGFRAGALFNHKIKLGFEGRKNVFNDLPAAGARRWIWFHAASLGEFEQGRPLMEALRKKEPDCKILLTFFSPSGYEIRRNYAGADHICYLPVDTPANARRLVRIVNPETAVFIKYEFWLNYIDALKRSGTRIYAVSAIFRPGQVFFKWYGGIFRKALSAFDRIFVQDKESELLLNGIGINNVTIAGDTRFDRVANIASNRLRLPSVEKFIADASVFVAGSTWPPDEALLIELIHKNPEIKFIIAPHETDETRILELSKLLGDISVRYTEIDGPDLNGKQVLIIDTIGLLSSLYGYGKWAYIGGGFGAGIHNTLEAAVYGIPVVYGPNYGKFREARDLIRLGGAASVKDERKLTEWFAEMKDETKRKACGNIASEYVKSQAGATEAILSEICK